MRVIKIKALRVPGNVPSGRTMAKRALKSSGGSGSARRPARRKSQGKRPLPPVLVPVVGRVYRSYPGNGFPPATAKVTWVDDRVRAQVAERQSDGTVRVRTASYSPAGFARRYR